MTDETKREGGTETAALLDALGIEFPAPHAADTVRAALERAYERGRADMREEAARAAKSVEAELEALLAKGKGEWSKPEYVRDETWAGWRHGAMTARDIERLIRAIPTKAVKP